MVSQQRWMTATSKSISKGQEPSTSHAIFDTRDVNTVGEILDKAAEFMPDKDVFSMAEGGDRWTYKEATVNH